jgi:oligopeptide/dipeptide ABC transporter ATP-binding protein
VIRDVGDLSQLEVTDLTVAFGNRRARLFAVDGVSFRVARGETLGIIGESGCGKSSLIRAIAGLVPINSGSVHVAEQPAADTSSGAPRPKVHVIFQDSMLALNPRMQAWRSIAEAVDPGVMKIRKSRRAEAISLLHGVGLDSAVGDRRPAQLSGGQRQRVAIARALASRASLVLCDEPVASLDASLQSDVLQLFAAMRSQHGLTYLFISHDLGSIEHLADRVGVMYMGKLVEIGSVAAVMQGARHPYTQMLLNSIPRVRLSAADQFRNVAVGEVPDPRNPPTGCRFRTRCPYAQPRCADEEPLLEGIEEHDGSHQTACHFWREIPSRDRQSASDSGGRST